MQSGEIVVTINRPVEEVFAFAADVERLPEWAGPVQEAWLTSGDQIGLGATYTVKVATMGRTQEVPTEVVGYEPNREFAFKAGGSLPYTSTRIFEKVSGGTRITEVIAVERQGLVLRTLSPLLVRLAKQSHRASLEQLKAILESPVEIVPTEVTV